MTDRPDQVESSLRMLSEQQLELMIAFHAMAALLCGRAMSGDPITATALADTLETQARIAGDRKTAFTGDSSTPNTHLAALARAVRACSSQAPRPFPTIEPGRLN